MDKEVVIKKEYLDEMWKYIAQTCDRSCMRHDKDEDVDCRFIGFCKFKRKDLKFE